MDEADIESALLEKAEDEHARLLRLLEVLRERFQQQTDSEGKPVDAVQSLEVELEVLRRLADAELRRLQARAAANAADLVDRGKLDAALLVESARAQVAATQRCLGLACSVAQRTLQDVEALRKANALEREEFEEQQLTTEALSNKAHAQQRASAVYESRLQEVNAQRSSLERELRVLRKIRAEEAARFRRVSCDKGEDSWFHRNLMEEHVASASAALPELWGEMSVSRAAHSELEQAAFARTEEVRRERLRVHKAEDCHRANLAHGVESIEVESHQAFVEWREESAEQLRLVENEVHLLSCLCAKLRARFSTAQRLLMDEAAALDSESAEDIRLVRDALWSEGGRMEELLAEAAQLREFQAVGQKAYFARELERDAMRVRLFSLEAVAEQELGFVPEGVSGPDKRQTLAGFQADREHIGDSESGGSLAAIREEAAEEALNFEEAVETHALRDLEEELAQEHIVTSERCEQDLASLRAKHEHLRWGLETRHMEMAAAAAARSHQMQALRARLCRIHEETATVEGRFKAEEVEAKELRSLQSELARKSSASRARRREVQANNAAARAQSVEMLRLGDELLVDLERQDVRCRSCEADVVELQTALKMKRLAQLAANQELAGVKRELLGLHDELSAKSVEVWDLQRDLRGLKSSVAKVKLTRPGLSMGDVHSLARQCVAGSGSPAMEIAHAGR